MTIPRRTALQAIGLGLTACAAGVLSPRRASAKENEAASLAPHDGHELQKLPDRLAKIPRRRGFKTVPMILTDPEQWDAEALKQVISYNRPTSRYGTTRRWQSLAELDAQFAERSNLVVQTSGFPGGVSDTWQRTSRTV